MTPPRRQLLLKVFALSDLAIMTASFALASVLESHLTAHIPFGDFLSMRIKLKNFVVFLGLLAIWHAVFSATGLYQSKRLSARKNELKDVLSATSIGTLLVIVAGALFRIRMITPIFRTSFWLIAGSTTVTYRLLLRPLLGWVRANGRNLRRILIVGTNERAVRFARSIQNKPELGYELTGFVDEEWPGLQDFRTKGYPIVSDCARFSQFLRENVVDEVMLALPMQSCYLKSARIAAQCREQGIIVRSLTNIFDLGVADSNSADFDPDASMTVSSHPAEGWPSAIKRGLDIVISVVALVILAPLFLSTALLIRWDSAGSIFFAQERIGRNKRRFRMYKFRTMVFDAESRQAVLEHLNEADGPVFKIKNDPRITRFGRVLRNSSIDELPQLFNVLRGDMSLVGPRPLPLRDYNGFNQDWHRRRFSVRPGLTCLWQVNGRNAVSFEEWMEFDLHYIDHWSLWLDLKLLVKTIPAVWRGVGAA